MGQSTSKCMWPANGSFVYIRGQDPRSQMKHEAGRRQRNHPQPGPASFQRRNGVRRYCRVKDRLGTCKKGWCLACPSSYSCCHEIGTEVSQKCMARITGCERVGNSERGIQRRNVRSPLESQCIVSTYTPNENALFTFTRDSRDHSCFLFF